MSSRPLFLVETEDVIGTSKERIPSSSGVHRKEFDLSIRF